MKKMKKGFTIVELVIVIGVIAILSAILIPTFVTMTNKANKAKAQQEVADAYTLFVLDATDGTLHEGETDEKAAPAEFGQDKVYIVHSSGDFVYVTDWDSPEAGVSASTDAAKDFGVYNGCHIYWKVTE